MGIGLKTRKMLWGRSGNRCALPTCRRELFEDESETDDASIVGDEAHIVAREEDGPRGKSELTPEQRDKYQNLVLLCKVHHKLIDDQPLKYTVSKLEEIKQDHIDWVNKNLSPDIDKQKDEEKYSLYVDKWIELADIENWKGWTSGIFYGGQPSVSKNKLEELKELNVYLLSRVWPKRYDNLEFAFINFRIVLTDFINVFDKYKSKVGSDDDITYYIEKIYSTNGYLEEKQYQEALDRFNYQVDLVQDLGLELTRSANYLCDQIRKYLMYSFRTEQGVLLIESGPNMNFQWTTVRAEFHKTDRDFVSYPGLRKFMETRRYRGDCFGNGVREEYFPIKFE